MHSQTIATSCDDTGISYLSDVPTTADSSFTDSSSHRFCVASVSSNGDYFYTNSDFDVDLSLNVLSGVLWGTDTLVIYLDTFLESVSDTTGGAGFVIKDTSAAEHIPTSYSTRNNKIFLNFTSALPTTGTFEFTKADPSIFLAGTIPLESFTAQNILNVDFDFDKSGAFKAEKDAIFLYLYTQTDTPEPIDDSGLNSYSDRPPNFSIADAKKYISEIASFGVFDFDESGEFKSEKDVIFLYLYTQTDTPEPIDDSGLNSYSDRAPNLSIADAKENIDIFL